ncbi:MAG: hypothetical protein HC860_25885, partial [Alkalinema sp. RU_4_3]|nr:hypothetical protein [Alkalinema sp. RU_4_3]
SMGGGRGVGLSPLPGGTIALQDLRFSGFGVGFGDCFGTLNVNVAPFEMRILVPRFRFEGVEWVAGVVETFSFCRCGVEFGSVGYEGWIYFPHPETKPDHFQPPGLVEVIAPRILGLGYGDRVGLRGFGDEVLFVKGGPPSPQVWGDRAVFGVYNVGFRRFYE